MLLTRMSSGPNTSVGRTIACGIPDARSASSVWAFPRKYGNGEWTSGFATLTWTIRRTPARAPRRRGQRVFSTAPSKVVAPRSKRTQYVL